MKSYGLKVSTQNKIDLSALSRADDKNKICLVKLYLFDKEFIDPLRNYLIVNKNMELKLVNSKLSGLDVLAPCSS